ncbi:MAG: hypothetical protein AB1806_09245 [Acidobacteriota bacterium]
MKGINTGRWLAGGIAAGVLVWLLEGAASVLYMADMEAAMKAHNLAIEMNLHTMLLTVLVSLILGLTLVFFYASARPRFGPGPRAAVIVAVALWLGSTVIALVGYAIMGLYPHSMLVTWAGIGLVEMVLAALVGGWIYRE